MQEIPKEGSVSIIHPAMRPKFNVMKRLADVFNLPINANFKEDPHFWYLVSRNYQEQRRRIPDLLNMKIDRATNLGNIRQLAITNAVGSASNYISLEKEAAVDSLTGAFNKRALNNFLLDLLRHQRSGKADMVVMFDIDNFKSFNDKYSHVVGDHVLQELVLLLKENIPEIYFLARYGGEEFMLVLPEVNEEGGDWEKKTLDLINSLRQKINTDLLKRLNKKGDKLSNAVSASFGVLIVDGNLTVESLKDLEEKVYKPVDNLLRQAKTDPNKNAIVDSNGFYPRR